MAVKHVDVQEAHRLQTAEGYVYVDGGGFGGARDPATGVLVDEGWSMAGLPVGNTVPQGSGYDDLRDKLNVTLER